ncbi:hypothetical protein RJT34_03073 [Clitoria ternatea]|uniref:Uncharacterized protein n=1 Tax=Clitoria ternatea TaxID=43366 RepID=A0AAN9KJL9_CLITE
MTDRHMLTCKEFAQKNVRVVAVGLRNEEKGVLSPRATAFLEIPFLPFPFQFSFPNFHLRFIERVHT